MDIKTVRELVEKIAYEMRAIGIPVSHNIKEIVINSRTKKRLGACYRKACAAGGEEFTIEISKRALNIEERQLHSIIAHELLHTCPGSFDHGKKWKEYGKKAENLLGYKIRRTMKTEEIDGLKDEQAERPRYVAVCQSCGLRYERKRKCPLVRNTGKYRCGKCGGKLKLL